MRIRYWSSDVCSSDLDAGISVTDVSSVTGFPEIMDGRVKTLHPAIHGGLLARAGTDDAVMAEHGIAAIDLLVVNLYPFAATVARADCRYDEEIGRASCRERVCQYV